MKSSTVFSTIQIQYALTTIIVLLSLVVVVALGVATNTETPVHQRTIEEEGFQSPSSPTETIFVSIPSYRDTDCTRTLQSLFENADQPDNLYIGLYEQNHPDHPDEQCTLHGTPLAIRESQIRRKRVAHTKAKGPLWARTQITSLYQGETFVLMIDAHSVFLNHWDTRMKNELHYLRDHYHIPRPILSCYPHHSDTLTEREGHPANEKRDLTAHICNVVKADRYPLVLGAEEKPSGKYYRTPFIGAGFVFTYGAFCTTLGNALQSLHLPHVFSGEEILFAAIAYTHGWDIYTPPYINVFHLYNHDKPSWFTDNVAPRKRASKAQQASESRLRALLDRVDTDPSTTCFGTQRTLRQFWDDIGFRRDRIAAKPPPNRTDAESVKEVYPQESRDKWCRHTESREYPLVEAFTVYGTGSSSSTNT